MIIIDQFSTALRHCCDSFWSVNLRDAFYAEFVRKLLNLNYSMLNDVAVVHGVGTFNNYSFKVSLRMYVFRWLVLPWKSYQSCLHSSVLHVITLRWSPYICLFYCRFLMRNRVAFFMLFIHHVDCPSASGSLLGLCVLKLIRQVASLFKLTNYYPL
jgi:hypothetical protein